MIDLEIEMKGHGRKLPDEYSQHKIVDRTSQTCLGDLAVGRSLHGGRI